MYQVRVPGVRLLRVLPELRRLTGEYLVMFYKNECGQEIDRLIECIIE
jgi:hypothetical protein